MRQGQVDKRAPRVNQFTKERINRETNRLAQSIRECGQLLFKHPFDYKNRQLIIQKIMTSNDIFLE